MDSPDDFSNIFNIAPHLAGPWRSSSAPPELSVRSPGPEDNDQNDPRFSKEYSEFYYSMNPRDPRLPPPFNHSRQWPAIGNLPIHRSSPLDQEDGDIEDESLQRSISTLHMDIDDEESSVPNTPEDIMPISPLSRQPYSTPTRTSLAAPPRAFPYKAPSLPMQPKEPQTQPPSRFSSNAVPFNPKNSNSRGGADRFRGRSITSFAGKLGELCCDQHGSRYIQERLEDASDHEKELVFSELRPVLVNMALEPFGNYVIQKFFSVGLATHIDELVEMLRGRIKDLTLQMYGCRVVQKAFTSLQAPVLLPLVKELTGVVWECIRDQNGNHVIQCAVETVSKIDPRELDFLIAAVTGRCIQLATHAYGCRVIQRILEHCAVDQITPLLDELLRGAKTLVNDQYGNYVCQHIIEYERLAAERLFALLQGNFVELSRQKFSSNVVETMCRFMTKKHIGIIVKEFCHSEDTLVTLMRDPYGNFVVQKVVNAADTKDARIIIEAGKKQITGPRKFQFGRYIRSFFESA
ncbi:hypothetical protein P9112_014079 [Eukaryota sp. TZLM1-RC]